MSIKELVRFVSFERRPVVVREEEILAIQCVTAEDLEIAHEEYLSEGRKVRVGYGQFAGLEGEIIQKNGNTRLIIKIEGLEKAFSFNISANIVEAVLPK